MNQAVLSRMQRICADLFDLTPEEVSLQSSPETVANWDSLQHLNLVLALEQEFQVQFSPEEIEELLSVQTIVAMISAKL